jgi:tetratricopeptide (TPR) repeat protein
VWKPAVAAAALAAISAGAWLGRRRFPFLLVGWLWYLGVLVPVIGLVQVGSQAMADRYTYLPLIGLAIAAAWGAPELLRALPARPRDPALGARPRGLALAAAGAAAVAALCVATNLQLRHWRDSEALFRHAVEVTPDNPIAHAHLGAALLAQGRTDETLSHYREAIRLQPDDADVANALAWVLATTPRAELRNSYLAVRLAERAARLTGQRDPQVLDTLAAVYADAGRFEEAIAQAEQSLALAEKRGETRLAGEIRSRLDLYRARQPYREIRRPPVEAAKRSDRSRPR